MNSSFPGPVLRRIFLEAVILCILAAAVGLSLNFKLILNVFSGKSVAIETPVSAVVETGVSRTTEHVASFPAPVELAELDELLAEGAVLVDARSSRSYQQEHLAGALSLPFADFTARIEEFRQQIPVEQTLITYCSGYGCPDSFDLGVRLMQAGYQDVLVYEGGIPEWRDAGRPLEGGEK